MNRHVLALALLLIICFPFCSRAADPQVAHMVYFTLRESTASARERLIDACNKYLAAHDGTVYFSVGVMAHDLSRDVNDKDFDVSLNIVFRDKAAHDHYQTHPRHLKFIDENKDLWTTVRVFDSYIPAATEMDDQPSHNRTRNSAK